jgi:hypothetical protein
MPFPWEQRKYQPVQRAPYAPDRHGIDDLMPIDRVIAQLRKADGYPTPSGWSGNWTARCPAHGDTRPSLSISTDKKGRALIYCHAGCEVHEILSALGLTYVDLNRVPKHVLQPRNLPYPTSNIPDRDDEFEVTDEHVARFEYIRKKALDVVEANPTWLTALARQLGVSRDALTDLDVGFREDLTKDEDGDWVGTGTWVSTWPEYDGQERLIGILRRYWDGEKRRIRGSKSGLTIPGAWRKMEGPIYIVEGGSDVAAALTVGMCAIGRPSAAGGARYLAELLKDDTREVIVLGESDLKADGLWPGDPGPFAAKLSRSLGRKVRAKLPPKSCKDLREWVSGGCGKEISR